MLASDFDSPHPVDCLQHFSWALRVCRHFNNALNSVIKIDNKTPVEILQLLQYDRICEVLDVIEVDSNRRPIDSIDVVFFTKLAGNYLKNTLVIGSFNVIQRILTGFQFNSCWILIPRLKEWLDRHATQTRCSHFKTIRVLVFDGEQSDDFGNLMSFKLGRRMLQGEGFSAHTIERVASDEDIEVCSNCHIPHVFACNTKLRMVQDIMLSESNSWWIFHMYCFDEVDEDEGWFLMNYTLGKIYIGPDGSGGCYPDRGCWDPYRWRSDEDEDEEENDDYESDEDKQEDKQDIEEVVAVEKDEDIEVGP